jgi:hypothetical protein
MDIANLIATASKGRWTEERAWAWHKSTPWLVGTNYVPRSAINQLEMWQAETFNLKQIDEEFGWLAALGMNSMRVFLHDLLWKQNKKAFLARIEQFLAIAAKHKIGIMFVFFDSVWNPFPRLGKQRDPEPGVHNSYWVQSPGLPVLRDPAACDALEDYIVGIVSHFKDDPRVQIWDIWNEPDNTNGGTYGPRDLPYDEKVARVLPLMAKAFAWARSAQPTQPLTAGIWLGWEWAPEHFKPIHDLQVAASDVVSFHRYEHLAKTTQSVEELKRFKRPLLCTEYVARTQKNTFQDILPLFHKEKIAAYNWGAVSGKSQTIYPWSSWQNPFTEEPNPWHHDIFRPDGTPYDPAETKLIKEMTTR